MSSSAFPIIGSGIDVSSTNVINRLQHLVPEFTDELIEEANEKVLELDDIVVSLYPYIISSIIPRWVSPSNINAQYLYYTNVPVILTDDDEQPVIQRLTKDLAVHTIAHVLYGYVKLVVPQAVWSDEYVKIVADEYIDDIADVDFG